MIRHICLYTLTDIAHEEGADDVVAKLNASVKNMVGKVPGLICAEVKRSVSDGEHDLLFYSEFNSMDDITPYLKSELHKAHAQMADKYVCNRKGIDAEV